MKSFRKSLKSRLVMLIVIASLAPNALARPHTQVKTDPQVVAKLAQALEKSGYPYRKATENVWVISLKGKSMADINVLITSAENLIIIGAVIATKASMKVTPEMMFKLLRLVHDIDRAKIGFDDDEDLFVREELNSKCVDAQEFKSSVEQVGAAADKVHAAVKTYLLQ